MIRRQRTLLHVFPGFAIGGAQMRFVQLANHFGRDYRHLIVSLNGKAEAFDRLSGDLEARMLDIPLEQGGSWAKIRRFRRILKDLRPDLLVTSNWGSMEWALANHDGLSPHLHMEDGFGPEEVHRQLPRRVWTRRLALRHALVMLPSQTLRAIARDVWRLPERRLRHIPNGVDCARFATAQGLADGPAEDREPVIGTVATLRAEKNLACLLQAFALVVQRRPARLVIVGDGPELPELKALAADLGVAERVEFAGASPTPERFLPSFALFALSSDTEQMPLSVLEAMAAGCPVAATDVGDLRNMLAAENHPFVVAKKDPQALAAAILALLDSPVQARAIGDANARRAHDLFDQSLMFTAYRGLFDGDGFISLL